MKNRLLAALALLWLMPALALGVRVEVESGVPGRYAPLDAGAALFDAALRRLKGEKRDG